LIVVKAENPKEAADKLIALEAVGIPAILANVHEAFKAQWALTTGFPGTVPADNPTAGQATNTAAPAAQNNGGGRTSPPPGVTPPNCQHGTKQYVEGKFGPFWGCPAPRDAADKCKPVKYFPPKN
jgi:hypothetical protein